MTTAVAEPAVTAATTAEAATPETATTPETAATTAATASTATATATKGPESSGTETATAPVKYELAKPEHAVIDDSDLAAVTAIAKEKGWTNEQAQAAVNELNDSLVKQSQAFKADLDAHPEIGGTKFQAAQEHAMRALDRFLPSTSLEGAAFRTAMNKSGYGNYAPLMLLLSRIGKAMAEDKPFGASVAAQAPAVARLSDEEVFARTSPTWKPQT